MFGGAEVRGCGVDVCRSRGAAQEAGGIFRDWSGRAISLVTVPEGIGASSWLQLRISVCGLLFPRKSTWSAKS